MAESGGGGGGNNGPTITRRKKGYGLLGVYPEPLQCFINKKAFLVVFCLTCVLQGTFHTYFVSVITTFEKLFNVPSQTVGTLMMASEIGQVSSALLLPYFVGQGHRPHWMGFGSALFSFACLLCASPHLLLPPTNAFHHTISGGNSTGSTSSSSSMDDFCAVGADCSAHESNYLFFFIIFLSLLSIGFGQTAIFVLGIPYLDDNVANEDSPLYFSITIGVRILGPVTGFILGALCTRIYINPLNPPEDFGPTDPRWLGAWWLGMLLISMTLIVTSFFMCSFPRRLTRLEDVFTNCSNDQSIANNPVTVPPGSRTKPLLRNFPSAVRRLVTNKILLLRTASSVFHLLPISGLYTFLPKYLESQFRLAAFQANFIAGIGGILVMGAGIFGSGLYIRRREPSPRFVAGWVALCALVYSGGMVLMVFFGGCDSSNDIVMFDGAPQCQVDSCEKCDQNYKPVCGDDALIYFNPCHAGCKSEGNNTFFDCDCIGGNSSTIGLSVGSSAASGLCSISCPNFPIYLTIFMFIVLFHSTSEVGSMLLTLRCVEPRDKAMALGLVQFSIGVFGNVPCPVIYGSVVDTACVVWKFDECENKRGHCWVYDSNKFRRSFHGLTGLLMFIAFLIDIVVYFKARHISFGSEDGQEEEKKIESQIPLKNNGKRHDSLLGGSPEELEQFKDIKYIDED